MKKNVFAIGLCALACLTFVGCGTANTAQNNAIRTSAKQAITAEKKQELDYLVLVNKENQLPENWKDTVETVHMTNSLGDDVEVEKAAYDAYLKLKADLEKEDVHIDLDSALRSIEEQQQIVDDFTKLYGEEYVKSYVAVPGYSEHHTGLALDLYLNIDGKDITENDEMSWYYDIWDQIHEKLADYGFILRYPFEKENITGYNYEPWHIRYVNDPAAAKQIMDKGITLEEYLNRLPAADVSPAGVKTTDAITAEFCTEGKGQIALAEEGKTPKFDPDFPFYHFTLHLSDEESYVLVAKADDGAKFVKWQKDGKDYSDDTEISVNLSEDVVYTAVFAEK